MKNENKTLETADGQSTKQTLDKRYLSPDLDREITIDSDYRKANNKTSLEPMYGLKSSLRKREETISIGKFFSSQ